MSTTDSQATIRSSHLTDFSVLLQGVSSDGIDWFWVIIAISFGCTVACIALTIGIVFSIKPEWQEYALGWTGPGDRITTSSRRARRLRAMRDRAEMELSVNTSLSSGQNPGEVDGYYVT